MKRWRARRRIYVRNNGWGFLVVYIDCMPFGICEGTSSHESLESIIERAVNCILARKPARPWDGEMRSR